MSAVDPLPLAPLQQVLLTSPTLRQLEARWLEAGGGAPAFAALRAVALGDRAIPFASAVAEHGASWGEATAIVGLADPRRQRSLRGLDGWEAEVGGHLPTGSLVPSLIAVERSICATRLPDLEAAFTHLHAAEEAIAQLPTESARQLLLPHLLHAKGLAHRERGDYQRAFTALAEGFEVATLLGHRRLPTLAQEWGTLLWSSGQLEAALRVHTNPEVRSILEAHHPDLLARSRLCAAKCAIDLGELDTAAAELAAVEQQDGAGDPLQPVTRGYALLYRGELHLAASAAEAADSGSEPREGARTGFELVDAACAHFEGSDPPEHPGLLDGKITIARYAIATDDRDRLLAVLHTLLAEAERHGCLEARARVLLLESALFVSENPPLEAAFTDLMQRLHLINNPAILMQALANLYLHSLRHRETPDQAFLMARLRNLQPVLERSCWQDLYETHIEKRYSWAIENRLAELLEAEEMLFEGEVEC